MIKPVNALIQSFQAIQSTVSGTFQAENTLQQQHLFDKSEEQRCLMQPEQQQRHQLSIVSFFSFTRQAKRVTISPN